MYQHHIILKTTEQLTSEQSNDWYQTVKEFGPPNIIFNYKVGNKEIGMEYGTCDEEIPHCYIVPIMRDMTPEETTFVVSAWEYKYPNDFNIEISNAIDHHALGQFQNSMDGVDSDIDLDPELKESALKDMAKWHHNRWVEGQSTEGWRYGAYYNSKDKTHPAMRQWDDLSETHKRSPKFSNLEVLEWLKNQQII